MFGSSTAVRRQGACLQCRKVKRKCDQRRPQCTQCQKKSQICSLQVFKNKTLDSSCFVASKGKPQSCHSAGVRLPRRRSSAAREGEQPSFERTISFGDQGAPSKFPAVTLRSIDDYSSLKFVVSADPTHSAGDSSRIELNERHSMDVDHVLNAVLETDLNISPEGIIDDEDVEDVFTTNEITMSNNRASPIQALLDRLSPSILPVAPIQQPLGLHNSAVRRLLWDYFRNRALEVFLCWEPDDARLDQRYDDPYKDQIPAVAIANRPMMLASLALSAFHSAGGGHGSEDDSLITRLMLEAANELAASHRQEPRQATDFLGTIGTASFLYLLKPESYADMLPLSRSAALCLTTNPKWQIDEQPSYQAIMQIFRWLDICAQCSLKRYVPVPDEYTQLCLEVRTNERATDLSSSYASWFVHPLYAFAEDLITPLRRIAWLSRLRQQGCIEVGTDNGSAESPDSATQIPIAGCTTSGSDTVRLTENRFNELVEETEDIAQFASGRVLSTQNRVSNQATLPLSPDLRTELERLATAMDSTVVVLFYTRLKDMPWTTSLIRFHVRNVVESIASIGSASRFSNGIVFPLFMAGLEAVETRDREMVIGKIKDLPGIWAQRESKLIACLNHIWELRDADPGMVWSSWIHQVPAEYEDVIPA
ncbi:hypothetical protein CC79DRAFT_1164544 [Sarocladium strictum]